MTTELRSLPLLYNSAAGRPFPFFVLLLALAAPLAAQQPDTARTAPDTSLTFMAFDEPLPGTQVHRGLPVLRPALDAPSLLAEQPGSFVYDFGMPGWPSGWSPHGLPPHQVHLQLDNWPFDDLLTGRPRYDLAPTALLHPLHVGPGRRGAPTTVYARTRPFNQPQPLTELRYRSGDDDFQSISAMHMQRRRPLLFGSPDRLQLLGAYGGYGFVGAYDGSGLHGARQLYARLRYQQPRWSMEISNLYNRRRLGAHGGVQPLSGQPFPSIYNRYASTRYPDARRHTRRNDLSVSAHLTLFEALPPPSAEAFWTTQHHRYTLPPGTTTARSDRLGMRLRQPVQLGRHRIRMLAEGTLDRPRSSTFVQAPQSITRFHVGVRDSVHLLGASAVLAGQLHAADDLPFATGSAALSWPLGPLHVFAEGNLQGQQLPPVARYGIDGDSAYVEPLADHSAGRYVHGQTGVRYRAGTFEASLSGFTAHADRPADYYVMSGRDSVEARLGPSTQRVGLSGALGWREHTERGFYVSLQPTLLRLLRPERGSDLDRLAASLPQFFARGTLGARYQIFNGDLAFNLYILGRVWSSFRSRVLHPPTGLLALPPASARRFGPSGTVDVYLEARIRSATLFAAYENALSGTPLMSGTLLVPVYPLPAQRFRFGVYWPLSG